MFFIEAFSEVINNLGKTLMIPTIISLIGIIIRCPVIKAIKAGLVLEIGLIGIDLVMTLVYDNISPIADLLVTNFDINLKYIDVGWPTLASITFSTTIGTLIIPFLFIINIFLISLKLTCTLDIDIWNYWQFAVTGSLVYAGSNNILFGFVAAALHFVITLFIADHVAKDVQEHLGIPGISIPHASGCVGAFFSIIVEKIFSLFHLNKVNKNDDNKKPNPILNEINNPIFIGLAIGTILALIVNYSMINALTVGVKMAALMYLLPKMAAILIEGLKPISEAAKEFANKKFKGQQLYLGMDVAVILGDQVALTVGLLLIPFYLIFAMILPYNSVIPISCLASTAYVAAMPAVIHKGSFIKTLISSSLMIINFLLCASFFAPLITEVLVLNGNMIATNGGVSAISPTLATFLCYIVASKGYLGILIALILMIILLIINYRYLKRIKE